MLQNYKKGKVPQLCTAEEIIALAGYSTAGEGNLYPLKGVREELI